MDDELKQIRTAERYIVKMEYILDWANDDDFYSSPSRIHFDFDTKFVESVLKNVRKNLRISDKQKKCIKNIYNGFKIDDYVEWLQRN